MLKRGPYVFDEAIVDEDHFVKRYVDYAFKQSDAAAEYHEAFALFCLSVASAGLEIDMGHLPFGMRGNLYIVAYGLTTRSRKSTAMNFCKRVLTDAFGSECLLPEDYSPQGLAEQMAMRDGQPSALIADEFNALIDKMHNVKWMSGIREFLLTMYQQKVYKYSRSSKKGKEDDVEIKRGHLCIIGNVTPAVRESLSTQDLETGFLNRFAFVEPENRPPRMPLTRIPPDNIAERKYLADWLHDIKVIIEQKVAKGKNKVAFENEALLVLDKFQEEIENRPLTDNSAVMASRCLDLAIKLAMLIRIGDDNPRHLTGDIIVKQKHAIPAVEIAMRWINSGIRIVGDTHSSEDERHINTILERMKEEEVMYRREVSRWKKLSKRKVDDLRDTMIDRGLIEVLEVQKNGARRSSEVWRLPEKPRVVVEQSIAAEKLKDSVERSE